jgi:CO/xanthine dehydrogenase Mo-binding subunit
MSRTLNVRQGAYSVLAALVAEELDLAWDDIKVDLDRRALPTPATRGL